MCTNQYVLATEYSLIDLRDVSDARRGATSLDFYQFGVWQFHIANKRSNMPLGGSDTLHLSHSLHVNDEIVTANVLHLGDFADTNVTYQTNSYASETLSISYIVNDPSTKLTVFPVPEVVAVAPVGWSVAAGVGAAVVACFRPRGSGSGWCGWRGRYRGLVTGRR